MAYLQVSRPILSASSSSTSILRDYQLQGEEDLEVIKKDVDEDDDVHKTLETLSWPQRLEHFTFAWYAMTMSTGGVAFVLSVIRHRFPGLDTLGLSIFISNILLFTIITALMFTRFIMYPHTFTKAFTNPHEGFFFATFWLTFATMITNTTAYGIPNTGPWLITALRIAFYIYLVCATLLAIFYYHILFSVQKLVITNVLPGWVLPIFPAMLVGTLASAIAKTQAAHHVLPMLVAGLSYQGLGMLVAIMMYALYFGRLLTSGLPVDASRPAMFIAVGPPSFTALALIGMAQDATATEIFSLYPILPTITHPELIPDVLQILALVAAISLWALAFWFFAIALLAAIDAFPRNGFHLNWYAYVFPNVGFTIATIKIGERLDSAAILGVGSGLGATLFLVWVLIMVCHVRAVWKRTILWPGRDEDAVH
ncbi:hypothetical protein B7494_g3527 [Chlorociboria aeruginascens]|nr:hypothetical protein B7494_g3527 [Chlorociboria aeruginascens]